MSTLLAVNLPVTLLGVSISGREILIIAVVIVVVASAIAWFLMQRRRPS